MHCFIQVLASVAPRQVSPRWHLNPENALPYLKDASLMSFSHPRRTVIVTYNPLFSCRAVFDSHVSAKAIWELGPNNFQIYGSSLNGQKTYIPFNIFFLVFLICFQALQAYLFLSFHCDLTKFCSS